MSWKCLPSSVIHTFKAWVFDMVHLLYYENYRGKKVMTWGQMRLGSVAAAGGGKGYEVMPSFLMANMLEVNICTWLMPWEHSCGISHPHVSSTLTVSSWSSVDHTPRPHNGKVMVWLQPDNLGLESLLVCTHNQNRNYIRQQEDIVLCFWPSVFCGVLYII